MKRKRFLDEQTILIRKEGQWSETCEEYAERTISQNRHFIDGVKNTV